MSYCVHLCLIVYCFVLLWYSCLFLCTVASYCVQLLCVQLSVIVYSCVILFTAVIVYSCVLLYIYMHLIVYICLLLCTVVSYCKHICLLLCRPVLYYSERLFSIMSTHDFGAKVLTDLC